MSKRDPSSMGDDGERSQSPETPTPKVARTNFFPANDADQVVSNENSNFKNVSDEYFYDQQQPGPSRSQQNDALSRGSREDRKLPIFTNGKDSSGGGAPSPSFTIDSDILDPILDSNLETEQLKQLMDNIRNTSDEKYKELLVDLVNDPTSKERFKRFLVADSERITGDRKRDPNICQDSQKLLNSMRSTDPEVVVSQYAVALLDALRKRNTSGGVIKEADNRNPIASTSGCGYTQMEGCPSPSVWVEKGGDTPVVYTKQEVSSLPELATSVRDYIPHTGDMVNSDANANLMRLTVPNQIWEQAYDFVLLTKRHDKIRKMGQILFQKIFTEKEIDECRVRKDKNHEAFDPIKVRFVYRGVAWLLGKPDIRSQEEFDQYVKNNGPPLTEEDASFLRTAVFATFAYNLRKKAKTN